MRKRIEQLMNKVACLGADLEDKDLRDILREILKMLDAALPKEVEPD
jgi:hypothetical protein